jgi:coproporphyrinogen III oxidase
MQSNLPTHRALLTNLIDSVLIGTNASQSSNDAAPNTGTSHSVRRRHLLLTLHVIFPGMLLPAVDLLDRKLVTRMVYADNTIPPKQDVSNTTGEEYLYTVKSVAQTLARRRRDTASSVASAPVRTYLVHLDAWNCSCAGFALEAFPGDGGGGGSFEEDYGRMSSGERLGRSGWLFGGMSRDGDARFGETLPCCKHLLACLLAEKWKDALNVHVEDKTHTRDEMAGAIAAV